ncbi:hypothetical protein RQP54_18355 [Curvibacter sp. APW13]|uniref:hypothetical protein n=1 Tax=Curvibacter sp. APW13 TaxID=3077236 RepID=UPI0028DFDEF2|nr:hypothetical protein [Curvibacter sp. APW13]MDT8992842.1 hypothetical protein [Curvibacter sp. APW13]
MSNHIELRGVITHVALRATSLFMTVREETRAGSQFKGSLHTVKAYYPKGSNEPPEMWAQKLQHFEAGMTVIVQGKQSFERETRLDPASQEWVPVRHPVDDRDLYSPFIWVTQIDALFDPAIHTKRSQQQAAQPAQRAASQPAAAVPPARQQTRAPTSLPDDDLPPMPGSEVAWN